MKLVAWSALAVLIALGAWLIVTRAQIRQEEVHAHRADVQSGDDASAPAAESSREPVRERVELGAAASAVAPESTTASSALTVHSSIGLELSFVEWQSSEFDWQRIDLDHARCRTESMRLPCLLRAPGHVASMITKASGDVVLEPDALLVLESNGLRACTTSIGPDDPFHAVSDNEPSLRPELRRAIAWGWISDDRWALAVDSELAIDAMGDRPIDAVVRWQGGRRADLHFDAKTGARASWAVSCDASLAHAPLTLTIDRARDSQSGPLELWVLRVVDAEATGHHEQRPWGSIDVYGLNAFWEQRTLAQGAATCRFDSLPSGVPLCIAARDTSTNAYGRIQFVHDGAPRTLVLRAGFELTGRLISNVTSAPVATTDLWWQFKEGQEDVWGWHSEVRALALGPDGRFTSRGPNAPPIGDTTPLDPPSHLLLHVDAPGFAGFEHTFDTAGAQSFDCGDIRLTPVAAELALAPGHGLSPKSIRWMTLQTSVVPDVRWTIKDAAPTPDGGLELFLLRSEEDGNLLDASTGPRAWPHETSARILMDVLLGDAQQVWAFERADDGRYSAAPRAEHEIRVECRAAPSDGRDWNMGWQWHELWGYVQSFPSWKVGHTVRVRFSAPRESATLFWSATVEPPRIESEQGGSVPIDALPRTIVLR